MCIMKNCTLAIRKLLYYIKSEEYRNWLIENEKLLNQWDYLQIINAAQIDIRDKLRLLKKYKDELIKNGRITRRYDSACKCYEAAINLLLEESDVALFQVTLKRRRSTDDIEYTCDNTWPCKSFSEILEYTQERLDYYIFFKIQTHQVNIDKQKVK